MLYLEFYWLGHNFETNANLAMKFLPKIEKHEGWIAGITDDLCHILQTKKKIFWCLNYASIK